MRLVAILLLAGGIFFSGCGDNRPMRIVCIGDSLTACGGEGGHYSDYLQAWLPNDEVINKGIGGDTLGGGRKRFEKDVLQLHPDVIVIELGANDFWKASTPVSELAGFLESMFADSKPAGAEVVIASCFGSRKYDNDTPTTEIARKQKFYAQQIADFENDIVSRYGCYYVPDMQVDIRPNGKSPYWDDTNHPNKAGNELVARRIFTELKKAIAAKQK